MSERISKFRNAALLATGIGIGVLGVKACDSNFDKQIGKEVIRGLSDEGCMAVTVIPNKFDNKGDLIEADIYCVTAGFNLKPEPRQPNQKLNPQDLTRLNKGYRS